MDEYFKMHNIHFKIPSIKLICHIFLILILILIKFTVLNSIFFSKMSELKENVVIYIAGYIQRKVISKVDCQISKEESQCTSMLIDRRDLGGLIKPNKELVDFVKIADSILEIKIRCSRDLFCERNLFKKTFNPSPQFHY